MCSSARRRLVLIGMLLLSLGATSMPRPLTLLARPKHSHRLRRHHRHRKVRPPNPRFKDDPAKPLGVVWKKHLAAYFKISKPTVGAFVAIDVHSGDVVVRAGYGRGRYRKIDPTLASVSYAASLFKIVSAVALLSNGVSSSKKVCYHGGGSWIGPQHLRDNRRLDRRCLSLAVAFARSTNVVFAKLAVRELSVGELAKWARRLGFDRRVAVGNYIVRSTVRWPKTALGLARLGAGFGHVLLSPMHAAMIAAVVARGGSLPPNVQIEHSFEPRLISAKVASKVAAMMRLAASIGTGRKYMAAVRRKTGYWPAIKTGTLTNRDGSGLFNTWMVGFYPARNPAIAFAALFATRGAGPLKAGHLARYALLVYRRLVKAREHRS